MKLIKNVRLVLENEILSDATLLIGNGRILQIGKEEKLPDSVQVIDGEGAFVGPGFVDVHVHGGGGFEFFKDPEKCAEYFLRHGATTLLAASRNIYDLDFYLEGYERIRAAQKSKGAGRIIAGIYMEGPFMNPKYGANPERNLWRGEIRPERYRPLVDGAADTVKIWAIAPEREGIRPFLEYAKKVNPSVRFFMGHSEALPEEIDPLRPLGLCGLTHIMDATGRVNQWAGTRGFGPDEYCLYDDTLFAELISDSGGIHVSGNLQKLILKVLGADRILLITDANPSEAPPHPDRAQYTDLSFDPMGRLAGSRLTMDKAFANVIRHSSCSLTDAFKMASLNAARVIGLENEIGSIAVGKKANLVFLDENLHLRGVMLEGEMQKID